MISQRTDRKRRAESGERRAESGERRAESGERRTENGERRALFPWCHPPFWIVRQINDGLSVQKQNREQETGIISEKRTKRNGTRETGDREKITGVWDGKYIVNLPNNSKWRMTSRKEGKTPDPSKRSLRTRSWHGPLPFITLSVSVCFYNSQCESLVR